MGKGKIEYIEDEKGVKIISEYWETYHSKEKGGCLSSLLFKYGSNENILVSPLRSYIRRKEGSEYPYYEESECKNVLLDVKNKDEKIVVRTKGRYTSREGKEIPVEYARDFYYGEYGLVKVDLKMKFLKGVDWIIEIGTMGLSVKSRLNIAGYRPSPEIDTSPSFSGRCIWHEFIPNSQNYNSSEFVIGRYLPFYICIFQKRVEGIEIFKGDDIGYDGNVFSSEDGQSYCEIRYDNEKDSLILRYEPYGNWQIPIEVKPGNYIFSYYIGLPFSKGENKVYKPNFHAVINSKWPTEKQLDIYAESGIKVIRLHNDYREDGPFWRDGYYPPYDEENMKKMDWVIKEVHKRGMKIVPYFSLKELHPDCPEYKRYAKEWKRTIDKKLTILHNYAGSGEFGAQMCLKSGWLKFRKKSIDLVLSKHDFDGVYYDWTCSLYCNNPLHLNGKKHIDMEEFLDLIFWTRKRVGPDGLIFLHLSGVPMMVVENVADFVFTHEEFNHLLPMPFDFCPEVYFAGICEHQIVSSRAANTPEKWRRFVLSCFLEGLWVCPPMNANPDDIILELMKKLTSYNISNYSFLPSTKKPAEIDGFDIFSSLYWKKGKAIIFIANLSDFEKNFIFKINLDGKGFNYDEKIKILGLDNPIILEIKNLANEGIKLKLKPLGFYFLEINKITI